VAPVESEGRLLRKGPPNKKTAPARPPAAAPAGLPKKAKGKKK
jgi:hypothetical protein